MDINAQVVMRNLGAFAHAYGLYPDSRGLVEDISNGNGHVDSVGILLRDPVTKQGLSSCWFPPYGDIREHMLWVMIKNREVEAVPICTREVSAGPRLKAFWKSLRDKMANGEYSLIAEGDFTLRVHRFFFKHGVIEKYIPKEGYGYIRRARKGIFFNSKWCNLDRIEEGMEVSFIPVISRKGLQARAVEEVKS